MNFVEARNIYTAFQQNYAYVVCHLGLPSTVDIVRGEVLKISPSALPCLSKPLNMYFGIIIIRIVCVWHAKALGEGGYYNAEKLKSGWTFYI